MSVETPSGARSPWLTIWLHPRQTIRWIADTNPRQGVHLIACISGLSWALSVASAFHLGDVLSLPAIAGVAAIGGPLLGLAGLYAGGALYTVFGRVFGGKGVAVQLRAAFAWSSLPGVVGVLTWIPRMLLFGPSVFTSMAPAVPPGSPSIYVGLGMSVFNIALAVWSTAIWLISYSEVHAFSVLRGFASLLVGSLVIGVIAAVFAGVVLPCGLMVLALLAMVLTTVFRAG